MENLVEFRCREAALKSDLYLIEDYDLARTIVKMVCGKGNVDNAIRDILRQIAVRLEAVEIAQRRGVHLKMLVMMNLRLNKMRKGS